jgi:hypothetical protein
MFNAALRAAVEHYARRTADTRGTGGRHGPSRREPSARPHRRGGRPDLSRGTRPGRWPLHRACASRRKGPARAAVTSSGRCTLPRPPPPPRPGRLPSPP